MRLDEDDLYDYDDEDSFDEDAAIDEVVHAVKAFGAISNAQAEAELEKADWDIDVAIASLKRSLGAKQAKAAAKPAAKLETPAADKQQMPVPSPKGKLTPLQMLAQRRANSSAQPDAPTSKVAKLSLADLAAQRRQNSGQAQAGSSADQSKPAGSGSALDRLRLRKAKQQENGRPDRTLEELEKQEKQQRETGSRAITPPDPVSVGKKWTPRISYEIVVPQTELHEPSKFGVAIGRSENYIKRPDTNFVDTAKSAQNAFSKPSPDDIVINRQSGAFEKPDKQPKSKLSSKQTTPQAAVKTQGKSVAKQSPTLAARLQKLELKPSCSFVVIGHVDAGKSTLMGRLLLDTGALPEKLVQKYEHESAKLGKSSFWLAWALDATAEERERGVTVDIGEAHFETADTRFTVLDAPGHRDYVPNMISGVSQADLAVLVVDSDTNAFESGFALDGQTKEHAILARSLGLSTIIVAVNKMDTQKWDESRFEEITEQLTDFLTKKVGYTADQCIFVPTSGISGSNVVRAPAAGSEDHKQLMAWYDGPTLVGALNEFAAKNLSSKRKTDDVLRFIVSNAFTEPFQSTITLSGRVLSGGLEAGDVFDVVQASNNINNEASASNITNETATVKSVPNEYLVAGDVGEIKVDVSGSTIKPGDVLAGPNANLHAVKRFQAKVRLFDVPKPVLPGSKLAFHLGRTEDTVKVVKIVESIGGKPGARKVRHLGKGSAAIVELELSKPTVLALPDVCKDLGRFVLRLNGFTVGGGVVHLLEIQEGQ